MFNHCINEVKYWLCCVPSEYLYSFYHNSIFKYTANKVLSDLAEDKELDKNSIIIEIHKKSYNSYNYELYYRTTNTNKKLYCYLVKLPYFISFNKQFIYHK